MVLMIPTITDLPEWKKRILVCDLEAFVIINDLLAVLGERHGKEGEY